MLVALVLNGALVVLVYALVAAVIALAHRLPAPGARTGVSLHESS
jgi:hypothetical protein